VIKIKKNMKKQSIMAPPSRKIEKNDKKGPLMVILNDFIIRKKISKKRQN